MSWETRMFDSKKSVNSSRLSNQVKCVLQQPGAVQGSSCQPWILRGSSQNLPAFRDALRQECNAVHDIEWEPSSPKFGGFHNWGVHQNGWFIRGKSCWNGWFGNLAIPLCMQTTKWSQVSSKDKGYMYGYWSKFKPRRNNWQWFSSSDPHQLAFSLTHILIFHLRFVLELYLVWLTNIQGEGSKKK